MRRSRMAMDVDFWPGFTDVLAGMLLTMVFVLTLFAVTQVGLLEVVGGKDAALSRLEDQTARLEQLLASAEQRAAEVEDELLEATARVVDLEALGAAARAEAAGAAMAVEEQQVRVSQLSRQLRQYIEEISSLNSKLAAAGEDLSKRDASIGNLQAAVNRLRAQFARISSELSTAQREATEQAVQLSALLVEMSRKDERIEELEPLAKYRSEFLQKMSDVFKDNPNVKVVGDRFVFQSEVLFASASADLGLAGRSELDKFVAAFKQLKPRIPSDLAVNVQVQGHTDTDVLQSTLQYRNNWQLSTERALGVVTYLASQGIDEGMLSAAGYGEHQPRVVGDGDIAKAQNRRIEIRITRR